MSDTDFTPNDFRFFCDFVHQQSGLFFDENKFQVVKAAIKERIKATAVHTVAAYYELLTGTPYGDKPPNYRPRNPTAERELNRLLEILTVNETSFFRNRDHFRAITEEVLPRLIKRRGLDRRLRIWSAGCSTGQEPYSLAIACLEALEKAGELFHNSYGWKIEINASDISERVLKIAQTGRYRREDLRNIEEEVVARHFLPLNNSAVTTAPLDPSQIIAPNRAPLARHFDRISYEVSPQVKALVKFNYFNLAVPNFPPDFQNSFDLILCENVTIYFPPQITQQVIKNIHNSLTPGGFLFIGYSETLWQVSDSFKLINTHDTFYYQKPFPGTATPHSARTRPMTEPFDPQRVPERPASLPITDKLAPPKIGAVPDVTTPNKPFQIRPISTDGTHISDSFKNVLPKNDSHITDKIRAVPPPPRDNTDKLPKPAPANSSWKNLLSEGARLMKENDFEAAFGYFSQALQDAPENPNVLVAMAKFKSALGEYKEAFEISQKAVKIDPLCEPAHLLLAMIHQKEGRMEASIAEYQNTIYINFESVVAHLQLADIYRSLNQSANALKEYKSALTALSRYRPDDMIEDLPVELLKRTCENNIRRFSKK